MKRGDRGMSLIPMYIREVQKEKGLRRQVMLWALRHYIKRLPEEELVKQIKQIVDITQLKILWEAGLTAPAQKAATARAWELAHRRMTP